MPINTNRRDVLKLSALVAASGALAHAASPGHEQEKAASDVALPAGGANLEELVSLFDFEAEARRRMSHMEWEYVNGAAAGDGFGVAISLSTAGETVGLGDELGDGLGCEKDGNATPRSPTRMSRPSPKSTSAVTTLASPTAPIRSSACFTALSNDRSRAPQRVGAAYPARHR